MTVPDDSRGARVAAALEKACDSGAMLAGAVGLITNGRVTTVAHAGSLYPEGPKTSPSTLFGMGSITKLMTSVAVARRADVGLDEPVSDRLTDLSFDDHESFREVRIRDLLGHTSGLPFAIRETGPSTEALARFAAEDLAHHRFLSSPGELASYSPSAFSLIGRVLEVVSGESFPDALVTGVLAPSGMSGAAYPAGADESMVAWPHHRDRGVLVREMALSDNPSAYPAGFLLASIEDVLQFARALLEGWLVDKRAWDRISTEHASRHISHAAYPLALISSGYGMGSHTGEWNGMRVVRHPGRQQSYRCSLDILPDTDSALVLLTNASEGATFNHLLNLCYEAVAGGARLPSEPALAAITGEMRGAWTGLYVQPSRGTMVEIQDDDGDLVYRTAADAAPLYHVGAGRGLVPTTYGSAPVWFPGHDHPVSHMKVWGEPFFRFSPGDWTPDDPRVYQGRYRDAFWADRATDLEIRSAGGTWEVVRAGEASTARVLGERRLATDLGLIELSEDGTSLQVGHATRYRRS